MGDDEEHFSGLFRRHYRDVVRFSARRTDPDQARDIAAETFLVAWRRFGELPDDPDDVLPWLYSVARNTIANHRRGDRRRLRLGARLRSASPAVVASDHAGGVVAALHIRDAMASLSPRDQETLQLVSWDGLDVSAAATVVGCAPRTFAVRLHRARRRLEQALAGGQAEQASPLHQQGLEMKGARS
ncbi:sigma-70 family RNA polymerase sigma factor [Actinomadura chibensis]|uniref:Sigma-70 family RNA polymerase sigma factor n=1 Tax=Actinomadura chibensis TaxID=392828 RepID=A0A5D0NP86_9ACTN|nr:sigma-70 family RNA polymerase sigma factor [Actinomadura chibensis]